MNGVRGVVRSQSNICDGTSLQKSLTAESIVNYSRKKMLHRNVCFQETLLFKCQLFNRSKIYPRHFIPVLHFIRRKCDFVICIRRRALDPLLMFRTLSNIYNGAFLENSKWLELFPQNTIIFPISAFHVLYFMKYHWFLLKQV